MMTKETCTVRFLLSSTRTLISLETRCLLTNTEDLPIFGTLVMAGATADHIKVLIPDTFSGPTVNADSPVVLQHVVGLTLVPAVDLSSSLPAPNLDRALCRNSVLPTLTKRRRAEVNPILRRGSPRNYMGRITWKRYINSQRDVVIPTMSAYADLALNGLADVLSLTRGV